MQNLYSVRIATPAMLRQGGSAVSDRTMQVESTDLNWQLDYYCDSIQLPSKQITTGQIQMLVLDSNMLQIQHIVRSI